MRMAAPGVRPPTSLSFGGGKATKARERYSGYPQAPRLLPEPGSSARQAKGQGTRPGHKARVFFSVLGLTADKAEVLREALLSAALSKEATPAVEDEYGRRYVLDFQMSTEEGRATVRSAWIVRRGEDSPRFTGCWVL